MINLNQLASEVTLAEGKKISLNVGQVKEVMKIVFSRLAKMNVLEIAEILKRYGRR